MPVGEGLKLRVDPIVWSANNELADLSPTAPHLLTDWAMVGVGLRMCSLGFDAFWRHSALERL